MNISYILYVMDLIFYDRKNRTMNQSTLNSQQWSKSRQEFDQSFENHHFVGNHWQ